MIFADASALVAIIGEESDAGELLQTLTADTRRLTSAVARWETVAGLCKSYGYDPEAVGLVDAFIDVFALELVAIDSRESSLATQAYKTYGHGRHPAALNMGDCFAYARAKSTGAKLL